jgi:hypothetical protein
MTTHQASATAANRYLFATHIQRTAVLATVAILLRYHIYGLTSDVEFCNSFLVTSS